MQSNIELFFGLNFIVNNHNCQFIFSRSQILIVHIAAGKGARYESFSLCHAGCRHGKILQIRRRFSGDTLFDVSEIGNVTFALLNVCKRPFYPKNKREAKASRMP